MAGLALFDPRAVLPVLLSTLIAGCVIAQREPPVMDDDDVVANDDDAAGDDDDAAGDDDDAAGDDDDASGVESFLGDVSDAVCDALLGCCSPEDQSVYFAPMSGHGLLAPFVGQMPPNAVLTEASCPDLLASSWDLTPFGDWLRAVDQGAVAFDADAYAECLQTLRAASCGEPVRDALRDSTCFGFNAPLAPDRRSSFVRLGVDGDGCTPISDGIGAGFYGTCDPTQAFCCYGDGEQCGLPYDDQGAQSGTCRPVSGPGETCSSFGSLQLCATGLECVNGTCEEPNTSPLAEGDPCIDDAFVLLGECVDSYCDLFGSQVCEPLGALGEGCTSDSECESDSCDAGQCVENTLCSGL